MASCLLCPAEAQDSSADSNTDMLAPEKEHTNSPEDTADEKEGNCIFGRRLKDCAYAERGAGNDHRPANASHFVRAVNTRPCDSNLATSRLDPPFPAPMLGEIGGSDGRQTAREVHNGGVSLQRLVVVLAVKAAVTSSRKEPLFELGHGLHTTCHARAQ